LCAAFELLAVEVLLAPGAPDAELLAVLDALDDAAVNEGAPTVDDGVAAVDDGVAAVDDGVAAVDDGVAAANDGAAEGAAVPTAAESSVTEPVVVMTNALADALAETTQVAVLCTIVHCSFRVNVRAGSV